jgi:hypothetical protein
MMTIIEDHGYLTADISVSYWLTEEERCKGVRELLAWLNSQTDSTLLVCETDPEGIIITWRSFFKSPGIFVGTLFAW